MATGITKRHKPTCGGGLRCRCDTYQAWISVKRDGKFAKVKKQFSGQGAYAAAKQWRVDMLGAQAKGALPPTADRRRVAEALDEWLDDVDADRAFPRGARSYKPATKRAYRSAVEHYVKTSRLGHLHMTEVRRADVQRFAEDLLGDGLGPSTVANILCPLRAFYRRLVEDEAISVNPVTRLRLPHPGERRAKRIAPPDEAAKLIAALPENDRPLWATAFYAGLRRGELQALRVRNVDFGRSRIRVVRGWDQEEGPIAPKSARGRREVPLLAVLRDHLDEHVLRTERSGDDLLLGRTTTSPFAPTATGKRSRRQWEKAGLEPITLHEARHTFASLLIDSGANPKAIQAFMGHAKIDTTFDVYGHLLPGSHDEVRARMDSYLAGEHSAGALTKG